MNSNKHKPDCKTNITCAVYHNDGICPDRNVCTCNSAKHEPLKPLPDTHPAVSPLPDTHPDSNKQTWGEETILRKQIEEGLKGEIRTMVRMTELMSPKNEAELFATVLPNLTVFVHELVTNKLATYREGVIEDCVNTAINAGGVASEDTIKIVRALRELKAIKEMGV